MLSRACRLGQRARLKRYLSPVHSGSVDMTSVHSGSVDTSGKGCLLYLALSPVTN
ncbi:hypothetical protein DPMN_001552 [Dreissena polymorpha]|uniref:Uncharacterized protein n=1 Tax=Dreissena polymorpha TaxID=45954 RepID=A0A9D4MLK2_DREPO|nr:hypothetical protein DPMN_001552 [Dreissena polymorpha]